MKRAKAATVTDLEGAVLGVLASEGPATSYALARVFATSQAAYWSGSAGAIYPLMRRLEGRKLIKGEAASTGRRKAKLYALTASGRTAFERWLLDAERAADMGFDPLRTRLFFLPLVSAGEQARFFDAVAEQTQAALTAQALDDDERSRWVNTSWLKTRQTWLAQCRRRKDLSGPA